MAGKKKKPDPKPSGDGAGTEYDTTARLRSKFVYRLKQIANAEGARAGRRVPVGEIIERELAHWVAEQWAAIQAED